MGKTELGRVLALPGGEVQLRVRQAAGARLRRLEREETRARAKGENAAILPARVAHGLSERQAWLLHRHAHNRSCAGGMRARGRDWATGAALVRRGLFEEKQRALAGGERPFPRTSWFAITDEGRRVAALLSESIPVCQGKKAEVKIHA